MPFTSKLYQLLHKIAPFSHIAHSLEFCFRQSIIIYKNHRPMRKYFSKINLRAVISAIGSYVLSNWRISCDLTRTNARLLMSPTISLANSSVFKTSAEQFSFAHILLVFPWNMSVDVWCKRYSFLTIYLDDSSDLHVSSISRERKREE